MEDGEGGVDKKLTFWVLHPLRSLPLKGEESLSDYVFSIMGSLVHLANSNGITMRSRAETILVNSPCRSWLLLIASPHQVRCATRNWAESGL